METGDNLFKRNNFKQIKDITLNDMVLTHNNTYSYTVIPAITFYFIDFSHLLSFVGNRSLFSSLFLLSSVLLSASIFRLMPYPLFLLRTTDFHLIQFNSYIEGVYHMVIVDSEVKIFL